MNYNIKAYYIFSHQAEAIVILAKKKKKKKPSAK